MRFAILTCSLCLVLAAPAALAADDEWEKIPGTAKDLAIGADGTVWIIGTKEDGGGHQVERWNGKSFDKVEGAGVRIAVGPKGDPWVVNDKGAIWRREKNKWEKVAGSAREIGIGPEGFIWIVSTTEGKGGYTVSASIDKGKEWSEGGFAAVHIALGPNIIWLVNDKGDISRCEKDQLEKVPGSARDIAAGADGTVWIVGKKEAKGGYEISRWNGKAWDKVEGGAVKIAVDPKGKPWIIKSDNTIYRKK